MFLPARLSSSMESKIKIQGPYDRGQPVCTVRAVVRNQHVWNKVENDRPGRLGDRNLISWQIAFYVACDVPDLNMKIPVTHGFGFERQIGHHQQHEDCADNYRPIEFIQFKKFHLAGYYCMQE
jgi:hypothetical protein